eukprot:scaffold4762_cov398-Prasinococcus_capsulatus_cf.AAC.7
MANRGRCELRPAPGAFQTNMPGACTPRGRCRALASLPVSFHAAGTLARPWPVEREHVPGGLHPPARLGRAARW